ncbi:MAG: hypothetical protein JWM80_5969 [Cyanobacteria bacterium RYN_339]|nr:hypothetical protein [Cyanobacteria bacterium RYN_339]
MPEQTFPLRAFPRRLARSLASFAAAGTVMAGVVYQDGGFGHLLPLVMLGLCWLIPLAFWFQIRRNGFDPLARFVATEAGLEAHLREGGARFIPWAGIRKLVQVDGFRHRAWAIETDEAPLRWYGDLEDPDGFAALVAERTGLAWVVQAG